MPFVKNDHGLKLDARYYQITILTSLTLYGIFWLEFDMFWWWPLVSVSSTLMAQFIFGKIFRVKKFDPKSPLISGLSLSLLLRSDSILWLLLGAFLTIGSKYIFRHHQKHFFNPTNFGIVVLLIFSNQVWVSPGQWGSWAFFAFLLAGLGGLVIHRAERSDVTYAFLFFYLALLFGRAFYLGDPLSIPLHQMQNGAFLLFTFFMISDPKTTPNSRWGRILFAALVAVTAWYLQFEMFRRNALMWALAGWAIAVPLIDLLLPGKVYQWKEKHPFKIPKATYLPPLQNRQGAF